MNDQEIMAKWKECATPTCAECLGHGMSLLVVDTYPATRFACACADSRMNSRVPRQVKEHAQPITPSDAVPPDESEAAPIPITALGTAGAWLASASHAEASADVERLGQTLSRVEQERDEARRYVAQLTAMVRALSKGDAGTAASVLLTRGPEGSLFVVVAPTLDEQTVADLLGRQIADANTAREQGAAEMRERCADLLRDGAAAIQSKHGEPLAFDPDLSDELIKFCVLRDGEAAIRALGTTP